jgi:hypothetical protein
MSHAADRLSPPRLARPNHELTPAPNATASKMSALRQIDDTVLQCACDEIFRRWSRFVSEPEARAQAEAFRRHFETLGAQGHLTTDELDATLKIVADAMAAA